METESVTEEMSLRDYELSLLKKEFIQVCFPLLPSTPGACACSCRPRPDLPHTQCQACTCGLRM